MPTINILGCGKLGKTIGKLFQLNNAATIKAVVNNSFSSSERAVTFVGQGIALSSLDELPIVDIYLITSPDDLIQMICEQLAQKKKLHKHALVMHCSGSLSTDILISAKKAGCLIASVHPVKSFANPKSAVTVFNGTFCTFEGDEAALPIITKLFTSIGGKILKISKENKKLYHASLIMTNNYLVTLHYHAMQNLIVSGVEKSTAKQLAMKMIHDACQHLENLDHQSALTGPIQRGDINTVAAHLEALNKYPLSKNIYSSLGVGTLPLTTHSQELKEKFTALFDKS